MSEVDAAGVLMITIDKYSKPAHHVFFYQEGCAIAPNAAFV
jgi:hypothetical protein